MSLENYVQWIKAHERLLLVAVGGLVLWFAIGKIDTLIANHDAATLHQAQVVADKQEQINYNLAKQAEQAAADYKALAEKVSAQNAALEQANVTLATALTKQQKTDAALPPTELVARWNTLVPAAGSTVTPTGVALPSTGAIATVQELERVPVLSSQIENDRTQIANDGKLIDAGISEKQSLYAEVDGLKLQIVDDTKVCKAQIAEVKAVARKSKLRWFTIGFITGFISRQIIKP
jgi:hypothetical protein